MKLAVFGFAFVAATCNYKCCQSRDCGDWAFCDFALDYGGFCQRCPGKTDQACNSKWNQWGTHECIGTCTDYRPPWLPDECRSSDDCDDGAFCNFDFGATEGWCESCPGYCDQDCVDSNFNTNLGTDECKSVCVTEQSEFII